MLPLRILSVLTLALSLGLGLGAQTPKKVLFDHTRHEEAGTSAEWVICSASEPDPSPANPATEAEWNGGISSWAFDLHRAGYTVQSLPPSGRVTYGDATNAQDLSHYAVYVIPEPYLRFSPTEKQAILAFIQNGGGLFMVGNHPGAIRYSGSEGTDAYTVFNDLVTVNGGNPFGFTFVPGHGPGDALANTTSTAFTTSASPAAQAIVHGSHGSLGLMDFHSFSYLNLDQTQNPSVQEILHTQIAGDTGSFIVTCTLGSGRVMAISDSSPSDDGTTTTARKSLHNSYTINSNRAFFLNATDYLASAGSAPAPVATILAPSTNVTIPAGSTLSFQGSATIADGSALTYAWAFGDGTSAAVAGPVNHAYNSPGSFVATFTATSNQGQSASATRSLTVTPAAFTLTASAGTGGTISPSGPITVANGGTQSFAITPNAGYTIAGVSVDGVNQGAISTYAFTQVGADHSIRATFNPIPAATLSEGFNSGTKTAYATASVTLPTGSWTLNDALLGSTSSDRKAGAQSVRVRNTGRLTMGFNVPSGAKSFAVKHGKYGSDASSTWTLWKSTNSGVTWSQVGGTVTTASTTLTTTTFTVNVAGPIRFEIRKTGGGANRVNFDDVLIAGY